MFPMHFLSNVTLKGRYHFNAYCRRKKQIVDTGVWKKNGCVVCKAGELAWERKQRKVRTVLWPMSPRVSELTCGEANSTCGQVGQHDNALFSSFAPIHGSCKLDSVPLHQNTLLWKIHLRRTRNRLLKLPHVHKRLLQLLFRDSIFRLAPCANRLYSGEYLSITYTYIKNETATTP